jgi:hypothetical protein
VLSFNFVTMRCCAGMRPPLEPGICRPNYEPIKPHNWIHWALALKEAEICMIIPSVLTRIAFSEDKTMENLHKVVLLS